MWELAYLSDNASCVLLCFVWCYVCELFGEVVRFVFVCRRCVSVEVDGIVVVGRGLFVAESLYGRPELMGVASVVPVSVKVLSP